MARMSLKRFLEELAASKIPFKVNRKGEIRGVKCKLCPVEALARHKGLNYLKGNWRGAAHQLGLSSLVLYQIVDAADDKDTEYPKVRKAMADLCAKSN